MSIVDIIFVLFFATFAGVGVERIGAPFGGFDWKRIARITACTVVMFAIFYFCMLGAR